MQLRRWLPSAAILTALPMLAQEGPFRLLATTLEADTTSTAITDMCALVPATERTAPRTLRFTSADYAEIYRCLLVWMHMGRGVAPSYTFD